MKNLKTVTAVVKDIMARYPQTRSNDGLLWLKVLEHQANEKGVDLKMLTVPLFLPQIREMGYSPFESVRRARQKIQEHHPELAASESVQNFRAENEKAYREYARGEV